MNTNRTLHSLKAISSSTILFMSLLAACTSTSSTTVQTRKVSQTDPTGFDQSDELNSLTYLSLSAAGKDYKSVSSHGSSVYWQPLLMPLKEKATIMDRDFILGISDKYGAIESALPQNGQCTLVSSSLQEANSDNLMEIELELIQGDGKISQNTQGSMFFLHDAGSRSVQGFGFFDADAQARCRLPKGLWYISSGFGEARTHKILSTQTANGKIKLQQHPRASLTIRPNRETKLRFGDIIRIGKLKPMVPLSQEVNGLPEVPLVVPDDLFRPVTTPSENFGVREYLVTSILVQRQEFNIRLEPGQYTIGLWRQGEMYKCSSKILIQPGEDSILACDPDMESSRYGETPVGSTSTLPSDKNIKQINFDATFLPTRLIGNKQFRNWLAQGSITDLMMSHGEVTNQLIGQIREEGLQKSLRFKLQPIMQTIGSELKSDGPYIGDFRSSSSMTSEFQALSFVRLLNAQAGLDPENILSMVFANQSLWQTIPIGGTSERALLEGAVPFTFRTSIKSNRTGILRTDTAEVLVTNGAIIEWQNPSPPNAGLPMKLGSQQQMRLRLLVPPGNTTEHFAMFINGARKKQWSFPKVEKFDQYRVLEIEEKSEEESDFIVGFAAWSQTYLPEFMYGIKQLPALAFTRSYCVDVNENNICDKQWKKSDATSTYQP
ncbi:MAG: hypothetical protein RJB13_2295 [Pseudomonadota bacterium]